MTENAKSDRTKRLEEEGEFAADYLEELLDIIDYDGDIEIDVENDRASVAIVSEESDTKLDRLVGDDASVLDALQELTRLAVKARTGEHTRLMLDVAGHRRQRKEELRLVAEEAITRVQTFGEPVSLDPMNPFERKVCHDVVAAAGLVSESEGTEPNRHLVILLAEDDSVGASDEAEIDEPAGNVSEGELIDDAGEVEAEPEAEVVVEVAE